MDWISLVPQYAQYNRQIYREVAKLAFFTFISIIFLPFDRFYSEILNYGHNYFIYVETILETADAAGDSAMEQPRLFAACKVGLSTKHMDETDLSAKVGFIFPFIFFGILKEYWYIVRDINEYVV